MVIPLSAMVETKIFTQIISNIIESAKHAGLGSYAVRIANGVDGLTVSSDGGITITGNATQILGDLIREYEGAMRAQLSTEIKATLHVVKYASAVPGSRKSVIPVYGELAQDL